MPDRHLIDVHIILVDGGSILLTQRRVGNPDFNGLWHLPSGKLDAGESVLDAASREAEEEVGVLSSSVSALTYRKPSRQLPPSVS